MFAAEAGVCVASPPPQYGCQVQLEHTPQGATVASKVFMHVCWPMATVSREGFRVRLVGSCPSRRKSATFAVGPHLRLSKAFPVLVLVWFLALLGIIMRPFRLSSI